MGLPRSGGLRSYGETTRLIQRWAALVAIVIGCFMAGMMPSQAAGQAADRAVRIVVLGDSLSAGYGLPAAAAFPARLEQALQREGLKVSVANAGVSGDTASDGLARLDWSVPDGTDAVILELGANDALRGIDPAVTRKALTEIVHRLKQRKIAILLCGMLAPRNLGADYAKAFDAIYPALATAEGLALYPFFLEGVATEAKLNQADGLHPTAAGVDVIVAGILPKVREIVAGITATTRN
jgi:acyl-CoA thioesterase-1